MTNTETLDYKSIDALLKTFLEMKGYEVMSDIGSENRGTFTYTCASDGMSFVVKLGVILDGEDKRVRGLKNEVFAVGRLWRQFPGGEAKSFLLPPGAEVVFDEEFEGLKIYGYSRFYIDGNCLGSELGNGSENMQAWIKRFVDMVNEIDALSELDLPRTKEKAEVDFSKLIINNTKFWGTGVQNFVKSRDLNTPGKGVEEEFISCIDDVVEKVTKYFAENKVIAGTVHGELIPGHIIFDTNGNKPYLINFTRLCQHYPRFFDIGKMYGWMLAVLGDIKGAKDFWDQSTKRLKLSEIEALKMMTNELILGSLYNYLDREGRDIKFGGEVFF